MKLTCKGRISGGYEVAEISDTRYWDIYHRAYKNWDTLIKLAQNTKISVADIIADKYKTCYAVGADIANSIALIKTIG